MGMPTIEILFQQLASTAVNRSGRGVLALVIRDETAETKTVMEYATSLDIKEGTYTEDNTKMIKQAFTGEPAKVIVVNIGTEGTGEELKTVLDGLSFNWAAFLSAAEEDQSNLAEYVKARNKAKKGKKVKAIVYGVETADDIHIVRLSTQSAVVKDETVSGRKLLARIAGILAGLPMTRSATYYELPDISSVTEPEDMDKAVDEGNLFLFNDEGTVRIARAVNSLTTTTADYTEDMKSIAIVEAMDLIEEDIFNTFKNDYLGKYKNSYDNQCLFIAAVNGYFKELAREEILDANYSNLASVDVEAQRNAWLASGKAEAANWDELTVKKNAFKRQVFLSGNVKILDAMEDLKFPITMM